VWVGNVKPADQNGKLYTLSGKCFGSYGCHREVFGSTVAGPVWANVMKKMTAGMPVKDFPSPTAAIRRGDPSKWPQQPVYVPRSPWTSSAPQPTTPAVPPKPGKPKPGNTPPPKK
jgi:membrane peptidoglycan carboxypeptidase